MKPRMLLGLVCAAASGCGPGCSDYAAPIGSTNYFIDHTDSRSAWLYPSETCGAHCPSIPNRIDWVRAGDRAIAVRRQVVNYYRCGEGYITSEVLNRFEQYVIELDGDLLHGPMSATEYLAFVASHQRLMEGIDPLSPARLFDGQGEVLHGRGACTDPTPI